MTIIKTFLDHTHADSLDSQKIIINRYIRKQKLNYPPPMIYQDESNGRPTILLFIYLILLNA